MNQTTPRMRIGQVHALLREEFPDIELSKIRYYEDKGLVCPGRSRKGYRLYSNKDVACLREAFRLASEEFVPLRIIRERLMAQGLLPNETMAPVTPIAAKESNANVVKMSVTEVTSAKLDVAPLTLMETANSAAANMVPVSSAGPFSVQEFIDASRMSLRELGDLREFGFVAPRNVSGEEVYSAHDLTVARAFKTLSDQGIEARNLGVLRRTVDRQVDLVRELSEPVRAVSKRRSLAAANDATMKLASDLDAMRNALLRRSLEENFPH